MPRPERRDLLLLGLALLAVVCASGHRVANGFVWDDLTVIVSGEVIHDWANLPAVFTHRALYVSAGAAPEAAATRVDTYRPVTLVTFFLDSAISGHRPIAYHLTNLLTHLACVVLVFFLARRLLDPRRRHLAPVAAAAFGLTPHLAEAHVWINGRSDLFTTLFGVAALLLHLRGRDVGMAQPGSRARAGMLFGLSGVAFFLGLLSKEVLLLALPAFFVFPVHRADPVAALQPAPEGAGSSPPPTPEGSPWSLVSLASLAPLVSAAALYLGIRFSVLSGLRTHGGVEQLLVAALRLPVLVGEGALELLVPWRVYVHLMSEDYRSLGPTLVLAVGAIVLGVLAMVFVKRRSQPALAWSVLWYVLTLAPAAIIATMMWPGFGRYLYLPFAGLAPGVVDLLGAGYARLASRHPELCRVATFAVGAYLVALGLRLALYTLDYHDERALWHAVTTAAPDQSHGWGYYGATLLEEGDAAAAIAPLRRAADLDPTQERYLSQLGWALLVAGDRQAALDMAATGLQRFRPAGAFHVLAAEALLPVRPDLAAQHVATCLSEEPGRPDCLAVGMRLAPQ